MLQLIQQQLKRSGGHHEEINKYVNMKYIHLSFKWVNREVNNGILKKKVNKYRTKLKKK